MKEFILIYFKGEGKVVILKVTMCTHNVRTRATAATDGVNYAGPG